MFVDGRTVPNGQVFQTHFCIVGGGPIGIAIALSLAASKLKVLLIESGGPKPNTTIQSLNEGDIETGSAHPPANMYRERRLGGSSTIWGGRCIPLDPIDFEVRDHVPHSGWPIKYRELVPYYELALKECEGGEFRYNTDALPNQLDFISGLQSEAVEVGIERYSPPTNFYKKNYAKIQNSSNLQVIYNTTCTGLRRKQEGSLLDEAVFETFEGRTFNVSAVTFVLAAGGLETFRLLATSNQQQPDGLGNSSGLLGRFYMCHIEGTVGSLSLNPPTRPVIWDFEKTNDGVYARRKMRLSNDVQNEGKLRNTIFRLHHANPVDPRHGNAVLSLMYLAKHSVLPEYRRKITSIELSAEKELPRGLQFWKQHARNMSLGIADLATFIPNWILKRNLLYRRIPYVALKSKKGVYPIDFNAEQEPNLDNRITLTNERDRFGIQKIQIAWKPTSADLESVKGSFLKLQSELTSASVGQISFNSEGIDSLLSQCGPVGGHHIGVTRMSDSSKTGVVNTDCRVFDVENLYIAGSSVFPTCGHANPTLTALALALRLADHLKTQAKR